MIRNFKPIDEYLTENDDDIDSFYSFNRSEVPSEDLENLSSFDDDETLTDEHEFELNANLKNAHTHCMKSKQLAIDGNTSSSSTGSAHFMKNNGNMPTCGVTRTRTDSARSLQPSHRQQSSKWETSVRKSFANHHLVPELRCDSPMPGMEVFEMKESPQMAAKQNEMKLKKLKQQKTISMESDQKDIEALQKFAFTEIWVERQQKNANIKRSGRSKFTADLEKYFLKENTEEFQKLTLEEQKKGAINKKLFADPTQSSTAQSVSYQTVHEPYVSPFKDLPIVPAEKKLPGEKSYITVPAGYDLTNLVKYNNPNHWHRRPTTRFDNNP
ncbi:hypothetical protein ACLKA6_011683 [Drosophila palustris]